MDRSTIWEIALRQSSYDCGCAPKDFFRGVPVVLPPHRDPRARAYLPLPLDCDLVSYGTNAVAQVRPGLTAAVTDYLHRFDAAHCLETPGLQALGDALAPHGLRICFMAEYFLPEPAHMRLFPCPLPTRLLEPPDFAGLYHASWGNALSNERPQLDRLALGAYDGGRLVALAGASADCAEMYQIGIDVLPEYRRRGIAAALVSHLAAEIFARGKVPFYCAAWCNLASVRCALRCGFRPAWCEVTARDSAFVAALNRRRPEK